MAKNIKIIAICGWAIPEEWFAHLIKRAFPNSDITVHYPKIPSDKEEAKSILDCKSCDLYIGYSLGSLWLLKHKEYLLVDSTKVLLAPIINFTKKEYGGKVSIGKLKLLIKQIKNKSDHTFYVQDFFKLCEINIPISFIDQIPNKNVLIRGLEFLLVNSVTNESLDDFLGIIGSSDPILDGAQIKLLLPQLNITPNIGHEPKKLLDALSKMKLFTSC